MVRGEKRAKRFVMDQKRNTEGRKAENNVLRRESMSREIGSRKVGIG